MYLRKKRKALILHFGNSIFFESRRTSDKEKHGSLNLVKRAKAKRNTFTILQRSTANSGITSCESLGTQSIVERFRCYVTVMYNSSFFYISSYVYAFFSQNYYVKITMGIKNLQSFLKPKNQLNLFPICGTFI